MDEVLPINFALMAHWSNWFKVLLMLIIFGIAVEQFIRLVDKDQQQISSS